MFGILWSASRRLLFGSVLCWDRRSLDGSVFFGGLCIRELVLCDCVLGETVLKVSD